MGYSLPISSKAFYMHHPSGWIIHIAAFVTPVMEHWLEWEISQWVHHEGSIWRHITPWLNALTTSPKSSAQDIVLVNQFISLWFSTSKRISNFVREAALSSFDTTPITLALTDVICGNPEVLAEHACLVTGYTHTLSIRHTPLLSYAAAFIRCFHS